MEIHCYFLGRYLHYADFQVLFHCLNITCSFLGFMKTYKFFLGFINQKQCKVADCIIIIFFYHLKI